MGNRKKAENRKMPTEGKSGWQNRMEDGKNSAAQNRVMNEAENRRENKFGSEKETLTDEPSPYGPKGHAQKECLEQASHSRR